MESQTEELTTESEAASGRASTGPPTIGRQLAAWVRIGLESVGGGASTLFLIRRDLGSRHQWITTRAFAEDWAVARITPGMSLIAYAALLGRRMGGWAGAFTAMFGLLAPAALVTVLMAAGYEAVHQASTVEAAIAGMSPVALGLGIGVITALGRALVRGGGHMWVDVSVVFTSFVIQWAAPTATLELLIAGAVVGMLLLGRTSTPPEDLDPAREAD